MKNCIKMSLAALMLTVSGIANSAIISADLDTTYTGDVFGDSGWLDEDTFNDAIDFYVFDIRNAGELSIDVVSDIAFGASLYLGEITEEAGIVFDNDGDFFTFFEDLTYVGGLSALLPAFGNDTLLINVMMPGIYTLAVGGAEGLGLPGEFSYSLSVSNAVAAVPEPRTVFLMAAFILAMGALRRHQQLNR
ncbi:PEP-CTERM sorting domain-containing protein [Alteromonas oceanisediminis]|uniref:PEP-CTERM sorting domain-containing protein n=1 Tax=Alteromonas oceanisediminis TaxID=2836180 RepID=UPI001BD9FAEA|nr:PEP-CTERM sorting domain-containing protein [Alteromonas oceanisediminis]MBT0587579.1 PEP-CTERM sorting domain-containing protein [Alteromonas oceanisediminis]